MAFLPFDSVAARPVLKPHQTERSKMNAMMNLCYAMLLATMGFAIYVFCANSNHDQKVEAVYGVKVVNSETHLMSPNRLIIERDGQKLRCDIPSSDEIENKTPMTCDDTLKISAKS